MRKTMTFILALLISSFIIQSPSFCQATSLVITRASKGSALTWTEMDTNLTNVDSAIAALQSGKADIASPTIATPTITTGMVCPAIDGSVAANGDLTLQGTADSTRTTSYVILQPNGGNVGIGNSTPNNVLDVVGVGELIKGTVYGLIAAYDDAVHTHGCLLGYDSAGGGAFIVGGVNAPMSFWRYDQYAPWDWVETARFDGYGRFGIGITAPTAKLHLPASTATANTASLKIDPGTVATTPVSGNVESDGTHLYWTDSGGTRRQLDN